MDLKQIEPELKEWAEKRMPFWSHNAQSITKDWLGRGLKARSITRSLKWGIPVPKKGFTDRVFYVWFDAPIGYISITAEYLGEGYRDWWFQPAVTDLYQFMGKDNVPFHSMMFPASLLGTRQQVTTVKHISATEYLLYEGKKFSKSNGVGVFCDSLPATEIEASLWRFYLIAIRPEQSDASFEWKEFADVVNKQLLGNFGNFFQRLLSLATSKFAKERLLPPEPSVKWQQFFEQAWNIFGEYNKAMEDTQLKKGLSHAL